MKTSFAAAAWIAALSISHASSTANAQGLCKGGGPIAGMVRDVTGASVAEAAVTLDGGETTHTATDGRFRFACVPGATHRLHIIAESFAAAEIAAAHTGSDITVTLRPNEVEDAVDVSGAETPHGVDNAENSGASRTLQGDDLKALADDPDDLLRQLQNMTAGSGGDPETALITVDGFQSPTKLPPKSSIAYIRINPDQFAAEYQEPPYMGGRVEVYTKPGQPRLHGDLFMTYGGSALNARDPFSVSKGTLGKQRFGFDLSGPVRRQGSDFALSLEHRSIDNIAVVNAVTLDANGNTVPLTASVPKTERLWVASARVGWQLGPKNTFIATYSANVNTLQNLGVGGTTTQEAGYNATRYEHIVRLTDITTISAHWMHEARASLRFGGEDDTPASLAPQVQVSGAFTGGGANIGPQRQHELLLEVLDDAIYTRGKHTVKFGMDLRSARERQQITQDFNGTYIFGGGPAPVLDANGQPIAGSSIDITGLEQYRRAKLNLAGGTPTAYTGLTGSPRIDFVQTRTSLFAQEDYKLLPNLKFSFGLRYYAQNLPSVTGDIVPRAGIAWSPDKKATWTLRAHAGMFNGRYSTEDATEWARLNGTARQSRLVYSPVYGNPFSAGAVPITTVRTFAPGFGNTWFSEEQVNVEHTMRGWNINAAWYWLHLWNESRVRNINTPINGVRPIAANTNILQSQNSGKGYGHALFFSAEEHSIKRLNLFVGYVLAEVFDTGGNDTFMQPQNAYSDAGEYVLRDNQNKHQLILNGTLHLPQKLDLSTETNLRTGRRYNVTTGFDNNGDGNFNDRPMYAGPGDPNAIATRFGSLVPTGGTAVFPRNAGTMPGAAYVDMNLSRSFTLTPHAAKDRLQTLSANVRAANILNHTNVRRVGGVLGSPLFDKAYGADTGRRIEFGLRYAF
ncbi:TonB-dependent receptor [Terriglobus roseus]|uniref:Carboxypeptidase regulatory-like domain-containing protein n=1 Tax=Terriglobus roseus TaxID=392734 RepID=A0A1H4PMJ1_9BACT|nr:carboxypeptidase regulatory-like domain-containing protein [Terriglobus roseus]SEC08530.1 Carboxypeptidase regulatory-like domain-containing protein [Terriglobus roseus]